MTKAVRMVDIAQRLGVSTVTVSKALAGKEGVSEEIRGRIRDLALEMGYKGTAVAKKARSNETGNVGILISAPFLEKNNSFYWEMYERVIARLLANNYYGVLEVVQPGDPQAKTPPRLLLDNRMDGIIVIGHFDKQYKRLFESRPIPMMFLDTYGEPTGKNSVISDGYYGMYAMTNYLIEMGHTDIDFVGTLEATSSINDRYFGYCCAMTEHGLTVTPDRVVPDRALGAGAISVTLPERLPTAFACNCDVTAYSVICQLRERGLRVPEDISIIGFDDYMLSNLPLPSAPPITTYAVDMENMARSCVDRLIRKIHNPHYSPNLKVVSGYLVKKETVLPRKDTAE